MILLLTFYVLAALGLFIYGTNCYVMVGLFLRRHQAERAKWRARIEAGQELFNRPAALPPVTTQIPIYNEANVVERVIRAAAAMDYPDSAHEIQILDDSTDETRSRVDRITAELRQQGKDIQVIRRSDRIGYKAGALRYGMQRCKGAYIAIFDADFVPPSDFLRQLVPALHSDPQLAFAQARWGHLNSEKSLLTRAQTIGIDGHFMVEPRLSPIL